MRFRVEAFFLLAGLGLLAGAVYAYYAIVVRPAEWPHADALIVSSRVVNPKGPNKYSPELVFRLAAGDSTRDVTVAPSWSSSSYDVMRSHVDRFPAGGRVTVAVNPDNPDDVRYDLGVTIANMILPGVLGTMGAVFVLIGAIAMRGRPVLRDEVALRLVPRIFGLIGIVLAFVGVMLLRADLRMLKSWPEAAGRVLESRVVSAGTTDSRKGGGKPMYDTAVKFRYVVNGVTYANETRYGIATSNRESAAARAEAYAPGSAHRIWHRPDDPNLIRFDLDSKFSVFFLSIGILAAGLVFLGFGGLFWRLMRGRAISHGYPAFGAPRDRA